MRRHVLRTVLATSDLEGSSDAALRTASLLATSRQAALHIFHCVPRPVFPYWEGAVDEVTRDAWVEDRRMQLDLQRARVLGDDTAVQLAVGFGKPSLEIGRVARDISADVIVLGPHEPRRAFDDLLGTTADRVLRTSDAPSLLANRPILAPITRVMVPTDFSTCARSALETVVDWFSHVVMSEEAGSPATVTIELLHVYAFASALYRPFAAEPLLETELEAARRRLPADARVALRSRTLSASLPVDGIARAAEEFEPDLIALGAHGYGFGSRALLGSTASSVARTVRQPVLLVPGRSGTGGRGSVP
ncbi:MAG TPA: universal stress protein [Longimicrobiales bacterium]|nr:universal stress protein [Longimicrobiales bacterium]